MPTVCKTMTTMTTRERRQLGRLGPCPASAGLAVRCRMPYLNSDCNSWATSATFTWPVLQCYTPQCVQSTGYTVPCLVHVSSMARMLLLQICKSLLVSDWVATPGTEGERFMALYGEGFSMFVRYQISQIHTNTCINIYPSLPKSTSTRLRKAGPSLVKVDSPTLKSYPRGILPTMCPYYLIVVLCAVLNVEMRFFLMQCRTIFNPQDSKMCKLSCSLMSHNPVSHLSKVIHV